MMRSRFLLFVLILSGGVGAWFLQLPSDTAAEQAAAPQSLEQRYQKQIAPLLERYCKECHSADLAEADVDLSVFKTLGDLQQQTGAWVKTRRMLDSRQMPPKEVAQPTEDERTLLQSWVKEFLLTEATKHAGDPGPVALRRLNNDQYNYTIRDLTGVDSLDPTREFPIDGAAGEGFTNTGAGQGMSPALVQKYLDAAKSVADHAVLTPTRISFSPSTSRRDQTNELLAQIQIFYRQFTADGGGETIDLQGVIFDTNQGGRLPIEKYLHALLVSRESLASQKITLAEVAQTGGLNERYLTTLWKVLSGERSESYLLDALRTKWRMADEQDLGVLVAFISQAQQALWKFNTVGQIGREDGPQSWMEPVSPIASQQEFRFPVAEAAANGDVTLSLRAQALYGNESPESVVWKNPRLEFGAEGVRQQLLLRDVKRVSAVVKQLQQIELPRTNEYLAAAAEFHTSSEVVEGLATQHRLNPVLLKQWITLLGFRVPLSREVTGHFTARMPKIHGYDGINGWSNNATPSLLTNSSDEPVTFTTLTLPPHGVTVHPDPAEEVFVVWRSPADLEVNITGLVADADNKCGNGAGWRLELRSATGIRELAKGTIDNGQSHTLQLEETVRVQTDDLISLVIDARDNNHVCDTTHIELVLTEVADKGRVWDLAKQIVDRILEANPLPDAYGNEAVWHFCSTKNQQPVIDPIPAGSVLAEWRAAILADDSTAENNTRTEAVQTLLSSPAADTLSEADRELRRKLRDWRGPLGWLEISRSGKSSRLESAYGLAADRFGEGGSDISNNLVLRTSDKLDVLLPRELASGAEFVATGVLERNSRNTGVQLSVSTDKTSPANITPGGPILVGENTESRASVLAAMDEFRQLFPPVVCYARIVPVDEVVTLRLFYREDQLLQNLMLDDSQRAELDRLWDELTYVSREPLQLVVALEQLIQFATQDRADLVPQLTALEKPFAQRADRFRQQMIETESIHLRAVLELADRAWRRPLSSAEQTGLTNLYQQLRGSELPHEEAIRLTLARVLTAPAFLYRLEQAPEAEASAPVNDLELASRLSYFVWSSLPDEELRRIAETGELQQDDAAIVAQTRRMLKSPHTRRLAIQFACQWLHLRDFDTNDDKNEALYPEFATLRGPMYEETVLFFTDMFQNDGSILDLLSAKHTFLNESLARHYNVPGITGESWQRVNDLNNHQRGGILGMGSFLSTTSGASRTSPILRGNWVYETLLGERLPRPPANVPQLPETVPTGLTERQLIEQHSSVAECAHCHQRIDPYGFALEQYDAIGRLRPEQADTKTTLMNGREIAGIDGLRDYLLNERQNDVVRQFCRKLLGYALGREVQLSDELLLNEMQSRLEQHDFRFSVAVEMIVASRQFREIRGTQQAEE